MHGAAAGGTSSSSLLLSCPGQLRQSSLKLLLDTHTPARHLHARRSEQQRITPPSPPPRLALQDSQFLAREALCRVFSHPEGI